jgi:ubiquinone/menaquinone biosynthesis C-methylase UbiE
MWSWAAQVLYPAQHLRRSGILPAPRAEGDLPIDVPSPGLGPGFSRRYRKPRLLDARTEHDHLVEEFDRMAEVYDAFVRPFSTPIFDEALNVMGRWLRPDARALDAGCGAGRELQRIARLVPQGEVVGVDLAAGMVNAAWRSARAHGLDNCAFVQSDVGDLPAEFDDGFDVVYSSLAHHHYPDPAQATSAILRVLRPGGIYCVVDPGPAWFNMLSSPLAKWGDPGWIGFHTPDGFRTLFSEAGFARTAWCEALPGFGVAIGQKAH